MLSRKCRRRMGRSPTLAFSSPAMRRAQFGAGQGVPAGCRYAPPFHRDTIFPVTGAAKPRTPLDRFFDFSYCRLTHHGFCIVGMRVTVRFLVSAKTAEAGATSAPFAKVRLPRETSAAALCARDCHGPRRLAGLQGPALPDTLNISLNGRTSAILKALKSRLWSFANLSCCGAKGSIHTLGRTNRGVSSLAAGCPSALTSPRRTH